MRIIIIRYYNFNNKNLTSLQQKKIDEQLFNITRISRGTTCQLWDKQKNYNKMKNCFSVERKKKKYC